MAKKKSALVKCLDNFIVCGSPHVQIHHCLHGTANRAKADKYGYVVPLCMEHHTGQTGVHNDSTFDIYLKQMAQRHFERGIGTRERWIQEFGKSYL